MTCHEGQDPGAQVSANGCADLLAEQRQPVLFVPFLCRGNGGQDLPFLTVVFLGKIPVDRGLGALVGKVSAPAPEVGRAGPVEVHIVRHRGLLS
jgi:hypothetical protein